MRDWLVTQNYGDGISKDEAEEIARMYLDKHTHEYRFLSGAPGNPEEQDGFWYLPYLQGANAMKSSHGILINKFTGECKHPKLTRDFAHILLQEELNSVETFIANQMLKEDANKKSSAF